MSKGGSVPDAWDDEDYESIADSKNTAPAAVERPLPAKTSRAERKAQHEEANKQLWESAENPETFHFVETKSDIPLKTEFKPAVKVLSRKPKTTPTSQKGAENGVQGLTLQDAEDDSEEEARKEQQRSILERQQQAAKDREEKQRRYAEMRAKLFGTEGSSSDSPSVGPQTAKVSQTQTRNRGKQSRRGGESGSRGSQHASSADQSPARSAASVKQLFDPNYSAKPGSSYVEKREKGVTPSEERPIREPRGPDGSGRGGHGFAPRGNKSNVT